MLGEIAGLGAAFSWASCTYFYGYSINAIPPMKLNLLKSIQASIVLTLIALIVQDKMFGQSTATYLMLAVSGILGIGLGDSCYFKSVAMVGPRISLLFMLLCPPISFLLTILFLDSYQTW